MRHLNKRHGIIATAREVWNATCRLGDGSRLFLRQVVRGCASAVRAIKNTRGFQMETRVVANSGDPYTYPEAMESPQQTIWTRAMEEESTWILLNNTVSALNSRDARQLHVMQIGSK
jgi:hypothetical protein